MKVSKAKVERRMAELELTRAQLAKRMDVYPGSVTHLMRVVDSGKELKPATVANLARGLDCTIDDLLAPLPREKRAA